ncbi:MAG: 4Fe-4S dicluster domain-containing protein [Deltaproteobacteria bacterium]|nr:4Fe-4S dicluster domain-containing protein [Deltaproteobacteria bacterium]
MTEKKLGILTDVTKCIGCEECVKACREVNELPPEKPWRWLKNITDLSSARWTTIMKVDSPKGRRFVRKQCRHCLEPACVEACIVGALQKTAEGPVIYDADICIGCRYCMVACPWEIPRYSWEDTVPYIQKCDLCYERATAGQRPACVEACPVEATIFGERDELLSEARRRLAAEPDKYVQKIWGEKEVGGTSVLYISDVDIKLNGLQQAVVDETPMPQRTFKVLRHMPMVFLGTATVMGGVWWIVDRRQKLMGSEEDSKDNSQKNEEEGADNP